MRQGCGLRVKPAGFTQADITRLLEVSRATYARYETNALLPHHLVEEFAEITGINIADLFAAPASSAPSAGHRLYCRA